MEIQGSAEPVDTQDNLIDDFEPAHVAIAGDGGPEMEPAPLFLPVVTESLCDRGPCRHLHCTREEMDAARPSDGSENTRPVLDENGDPIVVGTHDDGSPIYQQEVWRPSKSNRFCYPAAGVWLDLSANAPVLECSRWDPEDPDDPETRARENRRARYLAMSGAADGPQPEGDAPRPRGKR